MISEPFYKRLSRSSSAKRQLVSKPVAKTAIKKRQTPLNSVRSVLGSAKMMAKSKSSAVLQTGKNHNFRHDTPSQSQSHRSSSKPKALQSLSQKRGSLSQRLMEKYAIDHPEGQ